MKVLIATDFMLIRACEHLYVKDTNRNTLERYKSNFGEVCLCTRLYEGRDPTGFVKVDDIVDEIVPITTLQDVSLHKNDKLIKKAVQRCDLVIARVPSIVSYRVVDIARKEKKPLFSVAIACAWDAYWNHSIKGKIIAPYMFFKMRRVLLESQYALYVTELFLQKRYPSKCKSIGVSDVKIDELDNSILKTRIAKIGRMTRNEITLMTSGSVGTKFKGQQFMIEAIPLLNKYGIRVKYLLAGADDPSRLKKIVKINNVENQVVFLGMLSRNEINKKLDEADIYVQPSLQEGLPRAVVEAMSRGCPVVGANTGGIPELIDPKYVVKRKSVQSLCDAIVELLSDGNMDLQAKLNFERAERFVESELSKKRIDYYNYIKSNVQEHYR